MREWSIENMGKDWLGLVILAALYIIMMLRERSREFKKALNNKKKALKTDEREIETVQKEMEETRIEQKKEEKWGVKNEMEGEERAIEETARKKTREKKARNNVDLVEGVLIFSRNAMIQGMVMSDILGKPKGF